MEQPVNLGWWYLIFVLQRRKKKDLYRETKNYVVWFEGRETIRV